MRNICSINLMNLSSSGSLNTAAGEDELILQIVPLISQKTGFSVEITGTDGTVRTGEGLEVRSGWITCTVPKQCYMAAGTMKARLISAEETSEYVLFAVISSAAQGEDIQVKFDSVSGQFIIDVTGRQMGAADYVIEDGTKEGEDGIIWRYRKWQSGLLEVWTDEMKLLNWDFTRSGGNGWYYTSKQFIIPVKAVKMCSLVLTPEALNSATGGGLYFVSAQGYGPTAGKLYFNALFSRLGQLTGAQMVISAQVKARWK